MCGIARNSAAAQVKSTRPANNLSELLGEAFEWHVHHLHANGAIEEPSIQMAR
jgi:hypothetical protein